MELLSKAATIATLCFVVSSMLAVGSSLTVGQILTPLRNKRLVFLALLTNFLLMPLVAIGIGRLLRLDQPLAVALLILGTAAGAPFLPKLATVAKGNLGFAVGLMVLLMVLTVGYMPFVLPRLLEGATVDPAKIGRSLVLLMLLPLMLGLFLRARREATAARVVPVLNRFSTLSLCLMIGLMLVTNFQNILGLYGTRGVLASAIFLLVGFGLGWLLGGPAVDTRSVLALGTAQRNVAASLVVAGQNFKDPRVVVLVVVIMIVGLMILMPLARWAAKRGGEQLALPLAQPHLATRPAAASSRSST
jgi:bile acid:Na+ symporter, BASS family